MGARVIRLGRLENQVIEIRLASRWSTGASTPKGIESLAKRQARGVSLRQGTMDLWLRSARPAAATSTHPSFPSRSASSGVLR